MDPSPNNNISIAFLNVHGQSGLPVTKQKQIEDFMRRNRIDVLHCQEINIDDESFNQCNYIKSNYNIIENNALNKYGTATIVRNNFAPENIRLDTQEGLYFSALKISLWEMSISSRGLTASPGDPGKTSVPRLYLSF